MRAGERVWRADDTRRTRFHTSNGKLAVAPDQVLFALGTTGLRHLFGYAPNLPWWTVPAIRFLRSWSSAGALAFEYSSGSSTRWLARRCASVSAVEDDPAWLETVRVRCADLPNVGLALRTTPESYVGAIDETGVEQFDFISIDGSYRNECFEHCLAFLGPGGILLVDNTDYPQFTPIVAGIRSAFAGPDIHVFPGYAYGAFHPTETTVCFRR